MLQNHGKGKDNECVTRLKLKTKLVSWCKLCVSEKKKKREAEKPLKIKKKKKIGMLSELEGGQSISVLQDQISHLLTKHID